MIVSGKIAPRISAALTRFSPSWIGLDDERREIAVKVLIMCELVGGRRRTADLLNVSDNTIDNYRHGGRELKHSVLLKLIGHAGLPAPAIHYSWLFEGEELAFRDARGNVLSELPPSGAASPRHDDPPEPYVAGYDQYASAAGFGDSNTSPTTVLYSWFRSHLHVDPKHVMVLIAKGEAMAPVIADGTPVFIDISDRDLTDGSVFVFRSDDDFVIRRVQKLVEGGLELMADNSARYPPQRIDRSKLLDLVVVGRVRFPPTL